MDKICRFCFNAYVATTLPETEDDYFGPELTDDNDFSSATIGNVGCLPNNYPIQMYLNSGNGEATNIEICQWYQSRWHTVGKYYPKYCPECGRELDEYEIGERGSTFIKKENV